LIEVKVVPPSILHECIFFATFWHLVPVLAKIGVLVPCLTNFVDIFNVKTKFTKFQCLETFENLKTLSNNKSTLKVKSMPCMQQRRQHQMRNAQNVPPF